VTSLGRSNEQIREKKSLAISESIQSLLRIVGVGDLALFTRFIKSFARGKNLSQMRLLPYQRELALINQGDFHSKIAADNSVATIVFRHDCGRFARNAAKARVKRSASVKSALYPSDLPEPLLFFS